MKERLSASADLKIRQESWIDSPCSFCQPTPCCRNLPLTSYRIGSRYDFIQLCLLACYRNILICLKKGSEWSVYYSRPCSFLNIQNGKCQIHAQPSQSMICKSYDAHNCWYQEAFRETENETMIQFSLDRLIWLGQEYDFFGYGMSGNPIDWKELCTRIKDVRCTDRSAASESSSSPLNSPLLRFDSCNPESFLFFPLQHRPERRLQYELFRFRLGFPNMHIAVADNCWAYMLQTQTDPWRLERLRNDLFPALQPEHNPFSFQEINRKTSFSSEIGRAFVIADLHHIDGIEKLSTLNKTDAITRVPSAREIYRLVTALAPSTPDLVA
ncbi:MAG: hypothetical protein JW874_12085 [Spirochaetales bacterium]|nr:hypothetical protein [Spirochaetales bacterium]